MPTVTPNEFRDKWKNNKGKERSVAQEKFIDAVDFVYQVKGGGLIC